MTIDLISFFLVSIGFSFLTINILKLKKINKELTLALAQTIVNKNILSEKIKQNEEYRVESSNEFTAFLSQSRDWAFQYIEEVQENINAMVVEVQKDVDYFNKYGILSDQYPNYDLVKKFIVHYEILKGMLPDKDRNV